MRLHVRICIIPATSICTELRELRRSNVTNNKAGGRMWAFGYDLWKAKRGKWESSSYTSLLSRSCGEKFGHSSVLDSMLLRFWFSMSRNKKKVFRVLSNPRMRYKDFSLCKLLNVYIKKKTTQLKAKETHIQVNDFGFTVLLKKRNYTRFTRKLRGCKIRANLQSTLLSLAVGIPRFVGWHSLAIAKEENSGIIQIGGLHGRHSRRLALGAVGYRLQ